MWAALVIQMSNQPSLDASTTDRGFLSDVAESVRLFDIILITAVPIFLFALSRLPTAEKQSLAFNPNAPTVLSAFTAHFVHFDAAHLSGNLLLYLLVVPMVYLLLSLADCRRDFLVVAIPIVFFVPFLLSALNLFLPRSGALMVGFSGLAMAFVGLLPVALFRFLQERVPRTIEVKNGLSLFFVGATLIAFRMAPTGIGLVIGIIGGLIALLFTWRLLRTIGPIKRDELGRALNKTGYVELAVTAPIVFVVATFMAFPSDPFQYGGVIDLSTHLIGYVLGFTLGSITVGLTEIREEDEIPDPPDSFDECDFPDSSE